VGVQGVERRWRGGRLEERANAGVAERAKCSAEGSRRWSRLAGSLVDPAASSVRRDVTMAVVVIAERCVTVIS